MYICHYCGQVFHAVNYCNNPKCKNYGKAGGINGSAAKNSATMQNNTAKNGVVMQNNTMQNAYAPTKIEENNRSYFKFDRDFDYPKEGDLREKTVENAAEKVQNNCGSMGFATVPMQQFGRTYPLNEALKKGTIFPALDMPYDKKIIWRG